MLKLAFGATRQDASSVLRVGIGAALVSWQIAGVVEYNFGDSEVLLVVYFLLSLLSTIQEKSATNTQAQPQKQNATLSCAGLG